MSIYQIDYQRRIPELMPPDKRYSKGVAWLKSLTSPLQPLWYQMFVLYKVGAIGFYPTWTAGTYNKFDRVQYGQTIYESLVDNNTAVPTDSNYWRIFQFSFIGVDERMKYNGTHLVLEYALNTRFGTNFVQPPGTSDINFTINNPSNNVFVVGGDEFNSDNVKLTSSSNVIINDYNFSTFYNLVINVPVAVWNALAADDLTREKIMRQYVDTLIHTGIKYTFQTY